MPMRPWREAAAVYANPRLLAILGMGFASGLPLLLTTSTLSYWLARVGLDKTSIGLFALVVPAGVVHAYQNVGQGQGIVFNAPNRLYKGEGKKEPVDEMRHEDQSGSLFQLDK